MQNLISPPVELINYLNYLKRSINPKLLHPFSEHPCPNTAVKWTFTAGQLDRTSSRVPSTGLKLHPNQCTIQHINYIPVYSVQLTFVTTNNSYLICQVANHITHVSSQSINDCVRNLTEITRPCAKPCQIDHLHFPMYLYSCRANFVTNLTLEKSP